MSRSKFIPLPEHPDTAKCYVCHKDRLTSNMLNIGNGIFRCKNHRQSSVLKAGTIIPKKVWTIDFYITGTIEEG